MRTQNPGKQAARMMTFCVIIGLVALTTAIMAVYLKNYFIAGAMGIVAIGQLLNYRVWKKKAK